MVGGGGTEWNGVELERVPEGESGLLRGIRGDVEIDNAIPRLPLPPTTGPTRTPVSRSTALLSFSFFHSIFFFFFFTFSFISRFSSLRVAVFFFASTRLPSRLGPHHQLLLHEQSGRQVSEMLTP